MNKIVLNTVDLGSSTIISNIEDKPVQHIEYTAFGESFADWRTEDYTAPYRFTGKEQDAETGLYYYGARYYDPRLGRFLSVDPLAEKYGAWSPYAYTMDNPLKYTDPTGMWIPEYDDEKRTINMIRERGDDKASFRKWANGAFSDKQIDKLYGSIKGGKIDMKNTYIGRFVNAFMEDRTNKCDFNCFASTQSGDPDFNLKDSEKDFRRFISRQGMTEQAFNSENLKDAQPFKSYFGYTLPGSGGTELDHVAINAGVDRSGNNWVLTKNGPRPVNADGSLGGGNRFKFQKGVIFSYSKKSPDKIYK